MEHKFYENYLKTLLNLNNLILKMGYNNTLLLKLDSYQQYLLKIPSIISMFD